MECSKTYLYLISVDQFKDNLTKCKIGITKNVSRRKRQIEMASGQVLKLRHVVEFPDVQTAKSVEGSIHNVLLNQRIRGEWFWLHSVDIGWIRAVKDRESYEKVANLFFEKIWKVKTGEVDHPVILPLWTTKQAA